MKLIYFFPGSQYRQCMPTRFHVANPNEGAAAEVHESETIELELDGILNGTITLGDHTYHSSE